MIGGVGSTELIIILAILVMLFGAKRIPALARSFGQVVGEVRKGWNEFEEGIVGDE